MAETRWGLAVLALLAALMGIVPNAASAEPTAAADPTPQVVIVDTPAVLRQSPAELQASLGQPLRSKAVPPGDFRLPAGGVWRVYRGGGMQIDVDFERERSTTVMIGFPDSATAPRTYEGALEAVNLPSGPPPDRVTRDSREWHNLRGYFVRVIATYPALDSIDTIILSVRPLP